MPSSNRSQLRPELPPDRPLRRALLRLGAALWLHAVSSTVGAAETGYLATRDDAYDCEALSAHRSLLSPPSLIHIAPEALVACRRVQALSASGRKLTDAHNPAVVALGRQARIQIWNPETLFAPYAMTYDPDTANSGIVGWPLRQAQVQQQGFDTANARRPGCIEYTVAGRVRRSPYTSHCSAYAAWVAREVFGVSLLPTRLGDWCHVAAEQRNRMRADPAHWDAVTAVEAQRRANAGGLVLAARQGSASAQEPGQFNGHIAVVLPQVMATAQALQQGAHYPAEPVIEDKASFIAFLQRHGPEIAQAGGLNFAHTVTSNGFARHYPAGVQPGVAPIDDYIEFYSFRYPARVFLF